MDVDYDLDGSSSEYDEDSIDSDFWPNDDDTSNDDDDDDNALPANAIPQGKQRSTPNAD